MRLELLADPERRVSGNACRGHRVARASFPKNRLSEEPVIRQPAEMTWMSALARLRQLTRLTFSRGSSRSTVFTARRQTCDHLRLPRHPGRKDDRPQLTPPHLQVDTLLTRIAGPLTDPLASPSAP